MKRLKFLVDVPDKYTREMYKKGDIREFNNKRAEEILGKKRANGEAYAEEVLEEVETAVKKTRKKKENDV